jgi:hypothetical protein
MTDTAPILQTHPEYRHGHLVDFGNPEALQWMQQIIYGIIEKHKIDVYRQDFNMDPGPVWRDIDPADRIGIAEAKHIAGMYKFLDDMRVRFPGILQENCSSGGRRIDMEMIARAHTYCRSDYYIGPKPADTAFILGQNVTLNLIPYLPFQGCEFNGRDRRRRRRLVRVAMRPTGLGGGICDGLPAGRGSGRMPHVQTRRNSA